MMFDMAGTTVFDRGGIARVMADFFKGYGFDIPPGAFIPWMGSPPEFVVTRALRRGGDERAADPAFVVATVAKLDETLNAYFADEAIPVPGAMAVFSVMKQNGIFVVLDTCLNRAVADHILNKLKWKGGIIDWTVTGDEVNKPKPNPQMVFEAMKRFAVDNPAHVAKVGDTPNDLLMGNISGCGWVIGVTEGTHTREALMPYPHTHLVANVNDVPALLLED